MFGLDKKIAFNVWDFAGQLEYLTTHQFFITVSGRLRRLSCRSTVQTHTCILGQSERAVIMLLVDLSLPPADQRRQLHHWIEFLCSLMPNARNNVDRCRYSVLLIGAKADLVASSTLQTLQTELRELIEREHRLRWAEPPFVSVSSKSGYGVKAMVDLVRKTSASVLEQDKMRLLVPK